MADQAKINDDASALELLKCQLVVDTLRTFGRIRLQVTGSSMLPAVWPGDILSVCHSGIDQVSPDDIVLSERQGRLCAHRVVNKIAGRDAAHLITCGDQLSVDDPPVFAHELLGRVTSIQRNRSHIDPRAGLPRGRRFLSIILSRSALATRLMLHLIAFRRSAAAEGVSWAV
jgi:signal peptidase I